MLSEKRKKDRDVMAKRVHDLAESLNVDIVLQPWADPGSRQIKFLFQTKQGLGLYLDFDGNSPQPDIHVLCWHVVSGHHIKLNSRVFGPNVNPYHKQKATMVAYGFDELYAQLEHVWKKAEEGSAFL